MGASEEKKGKGKGAVAARLLRRQSNREEACDKRSTPQDVTSFLEFDAEGSICSKRSYLSRPKDLLATPLLRILPT